MSPCPSVLRRLFICSLEEDLGELDASNTWVLRAFEQPAWDDGQRWAFAVYWGMCSTLGLPVCDAETYNPFSPEAFIIKNTPKRVNQLNRLSTLMADGRRVSGP